MALLHKLHLIVAGKTLDEARVVQPDEDPNAPAALTGASHDKETRTGLPETTTEVASQEEKIPAQDAQVGVQKIEAVTLTWSKKSLAAILILIWLLTLVNGFKVTVVYSLSPFATSSFQSHSLLTVIDIVANAMTAAVYIPMAKMLDVWGRAESFLLMMAFCLLGLILMATSHNLSTFCAAQVFYSVGFGGLNYTWDVLAADVTNLRNRGLAFAFTSSPALITAFAGSRAAAGFYNNVSWRWGIGCWAIIFPFVALPLYGVLKYNLHKAEKQGIFVEESSGRTWLQTIWYIIREFDLPGVILFAGGFTVFLLPFTLATTAPHGWQTGYIIAMIVVGFVVLVIFVLYQTYVAPNPFLKHRFLTDRTVLGACLLDMTYQISYYCYASYLTSFLMVVNNLTVAQAGYVGNTFSAVAFVFLFLAGYLIRRTGTFRWLLFICVPLYIFALGLMIHFRQPNGYIGYIVMCEVFFSAAGSVFILCVQLAVLAAVDHQHVAAVLALLFVSGTTGGAIGSAVSGAVWTNTFEKALEKHLPASALPDLLTIYESLAVQLSYPVGSAERLGIQKAYGYAQTRMLAAGTAIMVLGFVWVAMMRDLNVKKMSQTRGNVL
ncbi:siderochrome-iron transporter MirB [Exophiala viscosa]|uniref:Siderochrome-iron transporter MirB n=1 Tax=Exophiala viscosa TaxID=2486360 RepID=A0AAN6ICJ4_9EURO|nr:siderochrome-iron transporter MirB [Exophiala viscosa]